MADLGDITGLRFNSSTSYVVVDEIGRGGMGIVFLAEKHSEDLRRLRGHDPVLKCVRSYPRDGGIVATDVYSFHVDRATATPSPRLLLIS